MQLGKKSVRHVGRNKKVLRKIKKGIYKKKFSLYNRHTNEPFTTNVGD